MEDIVFAPSLFDFNFKICTLFNVLAYFPLPRFYAVIVLEFQL